jgi:C-terminal processing protease CtpA/Prc
MIGEKVLRNFRLTFSEREGVLLAQAVTNRIAMPAERSIGLALAPEERGLRVLSVIPNTDAMRLGIVRGDYVTTINREPAKEWSRKRLRALRDQGEPFEVEVVHRGEKRRLTLRVQTLVE